MSSCWAVSSTASASNGVTGIFHRSQERTRGAWNLPTAAHPPSQIVMKQPYPSVTPSGTLTAQSSEQDQRLGLVTDYLGGTWIGRRVRDACQWRQLASHSF